MIYQTINDGLFAAAAAAARALHHRDELNKRCTHLMCIVVCTSLLFCLLFESVFLFSFRFDFVFVFKSLMFFVNALLRKYRVN